MANYNIIESVKFIKEQGKSYLIDLPLVDINSRTGKSKLYVKKYIPKSVSGFIYDKKLKIFLFAIQDWFYVKLESSWWENTKIDKSKYSIPLSTRTVSNVDTIDDMNEKLTNANNSINIAKEKLEDQLKPFNIKFNDVIKNIVKDPKHFDIYDWNFIVIFKNNQKGYLTKDTFYWYITINNNKKRVFDDQFIFFLLAVNKTLVSTIDKFISSYDKNSWAIDDKSTFNSTNNMNSFVRGAIDYLMKIDKKKAQEFLDKLNENSNDQLNLISILNELCEI